MGLIIEKNEDMSNSVCTTSLRALTALRGVVALRYRGATTPHNAVSALRLMYYTLFFLSFLKQVFTCLKGWHRWSAEGCRLAREDLSCCSLW